MTPRNENASPFVPPLRSSAGKFLRMSDLATRPDKSVRVRFVTPIYQGYEKWTAENRPVRVRHGEAFPAGIEWRKMREEKGGETGMGTLARRDGKFGSLFDEPAKEFNCAGVYNLDDDAVQLWSWTQKKFNKRLEAKVNRSRKGAPMDLVLTITRLETVPIDYDLDVDKAEPYTEEQQRRIDEVLESWTGPIALFSGGDPFAPFSELPSPSGGDDPFEKF